MNNPIVARLVYAMLALTTPLAGAVEFRDPLRTPAPMSELALEASVADIARAGERLVAVGQRGSILVSDNAGSDWRQVASPVSTDLTAVHFATIEQGWIVGHDGVVLHSEDGGLHWEQQLDGWGAVQQIADYYAAPEFVNSQEPTIQAAVRESEMLQQSAPSFSLLDVWFANAHEGFAIGSFNIVLHTRDGGETWEPWYERVDNPDFYHLYGIDGVDGQVYLVGERGALLKLDRQANRFIALDTPYHGSFFGVQATPELVLAYGLRGNAYLSRDQGAHWEKVELPVEASLLDSSIDDEGRILLASQRGQLFRSIDGRAERFAELPLPQRRPIHALALTGERVTLAGMRGLWSAPLQSAQ